MLMTGLGNLQYKMSIPLGARVVLIVCNAVTIAHAVCLVGVACHVLTTPDITSDARDYAIVFAFEVPVYAVLMFLNIKHLVYPGLRSRFHQWLLEHQVGLIACKPHGVASLALPVPFPSGDGPLCLACLCRHTAGIRFPDRARAVCACVWRAQRNMVFTLNLTIITGMANVTNRYAPHLTVVLWALQDVVALYWAYTSSKALRRRLLGAKQKPLRVRKGDRKRSKQRRQVRQPATHIVRACVLCFRQCTAWRVARSHVADAVVWPWQKGTGPTSAPVQAV